MAQIIPFKDHYKDKVTLFDWVKEHYSDEEKRERCPFSSNGVLAASYIGMFCIRLPPSLDMKKACLQQDEQTGTPSTPMPDHLADLSGST